MNKAAKNTWVTLAGFLVFLILLETKVINPCVDWIGNSSLRFLFRSLLCGTSVYAALLLMHKPGKIVESLGLQRGIPAGYGLGLLFTLPMLIGFLFFYPFNERLTADEFIKKAVLAGIVEELFFRGFLFGQLFRYARWGFVPSVLTGALLFGAMHLYQGYDLGSSLTAFGVTAFGAVLFSWIYAEWNYNLWVAIGLHTFMNGAWLLFSVDGSASGDTASNILRMTTILLAIALTIVYKKRKNIPWEVNPKTLWVNK